MKNVDIKRTTTTQVKVKKATVSNGKLFVDGDEYDLYELLNKYFEGCIFDISVVEKDEEVIDED